MTGFIEEPEEDDSFDRGVFDSGKEKRVPIILLLDTSGSMGEPVEVVDAKGVPSEVKPIDELNAELGNWAAELQGNAHLRYRAEIAVITFGSGGVKTLDLGSGGPFTPAAQFKPPRLHAGGVTPMLEAIDDAIQLAEERKRQLDAADIDRFRPLLFMMSDGGPTDRSGNALDSGDCETITAELAQLQETKRLAFFTVGVAGCDAELLTGLSPNGYWEVGVGQLGQFLMLASGSAGSDDPLAFAQAEIARLAAAQRASSQG